MKFAAPIEQDMIASPLEDAKQFKLYTLKNNRIADMEIVETDGTPLPAFLKAQDVGILICGTLSPTIQMECMTAGIAVFPSTSGEADMQVGAIILGMLSPELPKDAACDGSYHEGTGCDSCRNKDKCKG